MVLPLAMVLGTGTFALGPGWSLEGKSQSARHATSGLPYRDIYRARASALAWAQDALAASHDNLRHGTASATNAFGCVPRRRIAQKREGLA